ncbi:cytochrome c [Roseimaritima ulvae]|nr:cytochrome c [Roseimaritima ulvae]
MHPPTPRRPAMRKPILAGGLICLLALPLLADEKRAAPPRFDSGEFSSVFFADLSDAVRDSRPSAPQLRGAAAAQQAAAMQAAAGSGESAAEATAAEGTGWSALISATSIEDEVKRLKLQFDGTVTTPGPFKSGGYQDARQELSMLATLFAVISEYEGDVRWKDEGAAARDLLARTAFNCKAGSTQVYNEAKLRKADLQDIVSGAGLSSRDAEEGNDWAMIVDRVPLMQYLDWAVHEEMSPKSNNKAAVDENSAELRRLAETVAMIGHVLTREGLDDADDEDYQVMSKAMTKAALDVRNALDQNDADGVRLAVGAITQSCSACHEQFQ